MSVVNRILNAMNRPGSRSMLAGILTLAYKLRGVSADVQFHKNFNAWEYRINGVSYFSSGPGWAYDYEFLLGQMKHLSCNRYIPKAGDVVLDIGAGVGEETVIFSKLVDNTGKIYAIEAHPKTFGALSYMVDKNQLHNVSCNNIALSSSKSIVEINDTENSLANTILPMGHTSKSFKVNAITFDDFVEQNSIQEIDFVKMNVEGSEQFIIQGMSASLPKIKHMAISCHDFLYERGGSEFFRTKDSVIRFLNANNFRIESQNSNLTMVDDYVYATNIKFA